MKQNIVKNKYHSAIDLEKITGFIADTQLATGEIPWSDGDKTDPWDHVESAMGLGIGGYFQEAKLAFEWMADMQLQDGSWYSAYKKGIAIDKTRESNMSSYIAVGVFHYYLLTGNVDFLRKMWETVDSAIDFTLSLQAKTGEIYWAVSPEGKTDPMALLTGSSSIYMSIKCALAIANKLGFSKPVWIKCLKKLEYAICNKPYLFNMTKARYSMDWFYPILAGAVKGIDAQKRIDNYWRKFIIQGHGARCVSDQPWVTIAETSELCLALSAMGKRNLAQIIFNWICDKKYDDGSYWCGYTCPDMTIWPEDKITWTNAVVLMAADAVYSLTPGAKLFCHKFWADY